MHRSFIALALAAAVAAPMPARAIPVLQIYIDGATYDTNTETWVTSEREFDLWVVGDVDAHGPILGVKLVASFFGLGGSITLTPATTSRISDPSTPAAPSVFQSGADAHPVLPPHGIFNDPTLVQWTDYALGDMTLVDSPIGDYNGTPSFPTAFPDNGQVNVYRVSVQGWTKVHFDAYGVTVNTMNGRETTWTTPGSHDGQLPVTMSTWGGIKSLYHD